MRKKKPTFSAISVLAGSLALIITLSGITQISVREDTLLSVDHNSCNTISVTNCIQSGKDTFTANISHGALTSLLELQAIRATTPITVCALYRQSESCPYTATVAAWNYPGTSIISGNVYRNSKNEQENEHLLLQVDDRTIYASYDQRDNAENEPFGPIPVCLGPGQHTISIRHGDTSNPPSSAGSVTLSDIALLYVSDRCPTYLPFIAKCSLNYFEGIFEVDEPKGILTPTLPNDAYLLANGPLRSGRVYQGYPDDKDDYFSIYLCNAGEIRISLYNHYGKHVQLWLYRGSTSNPVADIRVSPYEIVYPHGQVGWYYIYISTGGGYKTDIPYTLIVTYP